jgi:cobalt/nickel transport system permease protein
MIASLLVRSLDRAQSIHRAMISRGFNGEIQTLKPLHWKTADTCFLAVSILLCIAFRFFDIPEMVGKLLTG